MKVNESKTKKGNSGMLISLVVFVGLTLALVFLVMIPRLSSIKKLNTELKALKAETNTLQQKYQFLEAQSLVELDKYLTIMDEAVPSALTLSELATLVNQTADKFSLKIAKLSLSSLEQTYNDLTLSDTTPNLEQVDATIRAVTGPFAFEGSFTQVLDFIQALYNGKYAARFSEIKLATTGKDSVWHIEFNILSYTMEEVKTVPVDQALPQFNQTLLQELQQKSAQ